MYFPLILLSFKVSPYESGYINGYNDALVDLLNALNIEHDFHHFD